MAKGSYSKRVTSEEEREGYLLVLKNKLHLFPKVGEEFYLTIGDSIKKSVVESYRCECRGPSLPHEHYFVRLGNLKKGRVVKIWKEGKNFRAFL